MIEKLLFDVLDNLTEKEKEDFYFLCLQNDFILKRLKKENKIESLNIDEV